MLQQSIVRAYDVQLGNEQGDRHTMNLSRNAIVLAISTDLLLGPSLAIASDWENGSLMTSYLGISKCPDRRWE
jgi:hypothetical protein